MRDGPRGFPQNSSCSAVLRCPLCRASRFRLRGSHPLRRAFPDAPAIARRPQPSRILQPRRRLDAGGLGSCAFARHYLRNHCLFSLPAGTEMFQFPAFAPARQTRVTGSLPPGFPIRTSPGLGAFAAHRRFSQLVTSFFASESHRHPPCALVRFPFDFPFRSL